MWQGESVDLRTLATELSEREITNAYRKAFTEKYGHKAVVTGEDRVIFSWVLSEFGEKKGKEVVERYLKLNDKFIQSKGHPPKMIKSNINAIIATLEKKPQGPRGSVLVRREVHCDSCQRMFDWTGTDKELESRIICKDCSSTISCPF